MSDDTIGRLWPLPASPELSDDALAELYAIPSRQWLRVNFIASLDGSATHNGLSGGLGDAADHRVFDLLRRLCDVIVVGAGTIRAEGYGPMVLDDESARWRAEHGFAPQPVLAVVSASLDLDPLNKALTEAPVRPIVVTSESSPESARHRLGEVADVLVCGSDQVDTAIMARALADRGLPRIHSEGGPHLFGTMIAEQSVDELCLTLSPQLEGGTGSRIAEGEQPPVPVGLRLGHVLVSGDELLLRYVR